MHVQRSAATEPDTSPKHATTIFLLATGGMQTRHHYDANGAVIKIMKMTHYILIITAILSGNVTMAELPVIKRYISFGASNSRESRLADDAFEAGVEAAGKAAAKLRYFDDNIRRLMIADDYVAAAKLNRQREEFLATEEATRMVNTIRAHLALLDNLADARTMPLRAQMAAFLPENLEMSLRASGRSLTQLINNRNQAYWMARGVPADDARDIARLFDLVNPYEPGSDAFFAAGRKLRAYEANPHDPAAARAQAARAQAESERALGVGREAGNRE